MMHWLTEVKDNDDKEEYSVKCKKPTPQSLFSIVSPRAVDPTANQIIN